MQSKRKQRKNIDTGAVFGKEAEKFDNIAYWKSRVDNLDDLIDQLYDDEDIIKSRYRSNKPSLESKFCICLKELSSSNPRGKLTIRFRNLNGTLNKDFYRIKKCILN
jgi:hypothetical protein